MFPTVSFLESLKPKYTYIRASLALRFTPDPFSHPLILLSLYLFLLACSRFDCLVCAGFALRFCALKKKKEKKGGRAFQRHLVLFTSFAGLCWFLLSPSLSSGFSSSSSAEAVATLSLWDASRSRKRLDACYKIILLYSFQKSYYFKSSEYIVYDKAYCIYAWGNLECRLFTYSSVVFQKAEGNPD